MQTIPSTSSMSFPPGLRVPCKTQWCYANLRQGTNWYHPKTDRYFHSTELCVHELTGTKLLRHLRAEHDAWAHEVTSLGDISKQSKQYEQATQRLQSLALSLQHEVSRLSVMSNQIETM